jgi:hypothetical protein
VFSVAAAAQFLVDGVSFAGQMLILLFLVEAIASRLRQWAACWPGGDRAAGTRGRAHVSGMKPTDGAAGLAQLDIKHFPNV